MIGGELVREGRLRSGLTQQALSERAGTTQSAIARLESGRTSPSLEDVVALLRLTGFDLRVELVSDDDSDRRQADTDETPGERLDRLTAVVDRLRSLRSDARRAS